MLKVAPAACLRDCDQHITLDEANRYYDTHPEVTHRFNIALFGSETDILHAARTDSGDGPGCRGSSKLGGWIRISHDVDQLNGGGYGTIVRRR